MSLLYVLRNLSMKSVRIHGLTVRTTVYDIEFESTNNAKNAKGFVDSNTGPHFSPGGVGY